MFDGYELLFIMLIPLIPFSFPLCHLLIIKYVIYNSNGMEVFVWPILYIKLNSLLRYKAGGFHLQKLYT